MTCCRQYCNDYYNTQQVWPRNGCSAAFVCWLFDWHCIPRYANRQRWKQIWWVHDWLIVDIYSVVFIVLCCVLRFLFCFLVLLIFACLCLDFSTHLRVWNSEWFQSCWVLVSLCFCCVWSLRWIECKSAGQYEKLSDRRTEKDRLSKNRSESAR